MESPKIFYTAYAPPAVGAAVTVCETLQMLGYTVKKLPSIVYFTAGS
jgi:hypothetical protein